MADVLNKYFNNLQGIFEEVLKIKNNNGAQNAELVEKRKQGALQFVVLKKINRQVKYDLRAGRDDLHREKLQVDSNRLQLQNLLYEVSHLKREIKRCHKFKSQDEDIELLPEEDYCAIIKPTQLPQTEHAKRLARLEWELTLRKQLSAQCKDLLNSKKKVFQDIVTRMERLTSFAPSLQQLLKSTQPLQEALQMPMEKQWKLSQLVQLLPKPLYLIYMNIHALEKNYEESELQVSVIGDEDDIQNAEVETQFEDIKHLSSEEVDDSEVRAKKRRHMEHADLVDIMRKRALKPHALLVRFGFNKGSEVGEQFVIHLRYFAQLGFVTAAATVTMPEVDSSLTDLSMMQNLLSVLYTDDQGTVLPIPSIEHELNKFEMSEQQCIEYLLSKDYGRPYRWLQRMCGLEAFNATKLNGVEQQKELLIPAVIERLNLLWQSRLNLLRQIKALMAKNISLYLQEEKMPSVRPSCSLVQWSAISWEEYSADVTTKVYIKNGLANSEQLFYRAVIVRGSAKMECLINVPNLFPYDNSLWAVCIHWNGEHNASNKACIKMLEAYVNSLEQTMLKHSHALLAAQLMRTMYSFDIYLETESENYETKEFPRENNYKRAFAGRMRLRPFKYIETGSENIFTQ